MKRILFRCPHCGRESRLMHSIPNATTWNLDRDVWYCRKCRKSVVFEPLTVDQYVDRDPPKP